MVSIIMDTIQINQEEVEDLKTGIINHLEYTTRLVELYGSIDNAIKELELEVFINNEAEIMSSCNAYIRMLDKCVQKKNKPCKIL